MKWQVTTQNELIDDIGDRTENVNARLLATTGYVSACYTGAHPEILSSQYSWMKV